MKAYSQDLRDRIIAAVKVRTDTREGIARTFQVSRSFVQKLWRRWQGTRSSAALPHGGGQPRALADDEARIRKEVARQRDATLAELCERVEQAGGAASSPSMMCRELQRLNLPRKKKSLHASERDTPRVKRLRKAYWEWIAEVVVERLKFIDESGLHLSLTRLYGRAASGVRVVDAVPQQPGGPSWTLIGALGLNGVSAPWLLEGPVDSAAFQVYVCQVLSPSLRPDDIVVMDNLSAHKSPAIESAIRARGAHLHFSSPYSPDLNPIEQCWSKIKTALRAAKPRTLEALLEALQVALQTITKKDAVAWFTHCGYCVHA
jgi:transposase